MNAHQDQPEWVPLPDGPSILVRGINSETAALRCQKMPRSVRRAMAAGGEWTDRSWRHYIAFLADSVLLGWDGITEGGQPLPFDRATARRVLAENYGFLVSVQDAASGRLTPEAADG